MVKFVKLNSLFITLFYLTSCREAPPPVEDAPLKKTTIKQIVDQVNENEDKIVSPQNQTSEDDLLFGGRTSNSPVALAETGIDVEQQKFAQGFGYEKVPQDWYQKTDKRVRNEITSRHFHIQETGKGNYIIGVKVEGEFITWPGAHEFPVEDTFEMRKYFKPGKSISVGF